MRLAKIAFKLKEKTCKSKVFAFLYRLLHFACGSWIGATADFKNMPCFPHGLHGIFISGDAKFGENCVIFHNVTIGSNQLRDSKNQGSPNIGNSVYIGANSCIIGNIKIGNNVRVGAGAVVTKDVPDNSTVIKFNEIITHEKILDNKFCRRSKNGWKCYENGEWITEK